MLLLITGTIEGRSEKFETIKTQIPVLFLDRFDYNITVRSIILESDNPIEKQVLRLKSDCIDKNPFNQEQEIYAFESSGSNYIFHEPKHLRLYKVQKKEFHRTEFALQSTGLVGETKIQILLEISRDVRYQ